MPKASYSLYRWKVSTQYLSLFCVSSLRIWIWQKLSLTYRAEMQHWHWWVCLQSLSQGCDVHQWCEWFPLSVPWGSASPQLLLTGERVPEQSLHPWKLYRGPQWVSSCHVRLVPSWLVANQLGFNTGLFLWKSFRGLSWDWVVDFGRLLHSSKPPLLLYLPWLNR